MFMNSKILIVLLICSFLFLNMADTCIQKDELLDCSNMNLTDCPEFNSNVMKIILDSNRLTNLTSSNCMRYKSILSLSVKNNFLTHSYESVAKFGFNFLDLSHNLISVIDISSTSIATLDLSHNKIVKFKTESLMNLRYLSLSNNLLKVADLENLIKALLVGQVIEHFDLSYNDISKLPMNWFSFKPPQLKVLNLSGNHLTEFWINGNPRPSSKLNLDLSNNKISRLHVINFCPLANVNLMNNSIATADIKVIQCLNKSDSISIAGNPINCSCSGDSAIFINWLKDLGQKLLNPHNVLCVNSNITVLNFSCRTTSTTFVSSSTTISHSITTTTVSTTTNKMPLYPTTASEMKKSKLWWILPVILILFFLLVTLGYCVFKKKQNERYRLLESTEHWNCWQNCYRRIVGGNRSSAVLVDFPDDTSNTDNGFTYNRLTLEDFVVVLCSPKVKGWVQRELTSKISLSAVVITKKVDTLPNSDFVLVVIYGNDCFRNSILNANVQIALQTRDLCGDVRLLIRDNLDFQQHARDRNHIYQLVNDRMMTKAYFRYDSLNSTECIDALNDWLGERM